MSLRIRTVARLTGVREATLRAWERRHGFPRPHRGENNYRTYDQQEVEAVRRVAALIAGGLSLSEAIAQVRTTPLSALPVLEARKEQFWSAVAVMDARQAARLLDETQVELSPSDYCDAFLMPLLREMGSRLDIAREHLASALIRQRLWRLVQQEGIAQEGPRWVLACPPRESHEGGLLALAFHLKRRGCQVLWLGADTPPEALRQTCLQTQPAGVALSLVGSRLGEELEEELPQWVSACAPHPVVLGGAGAQAHRGLLQREGVHYASTAEELLTLLPSRLSPSPVPAGDQ